MLYLLVFVIYCVFLKMDSATFLEDLDQECSHYANNALAPSTSKAYKGQRVVYESFCARAGIHLAPISSVNLCRYVAFLARSKKFVTVRQYLNVVRIIHLELGFPNPLVDNFKLDQVLRGIKRTQNNQVNRKRPILPSHLFFIFNNLDLSNNEHIVFWGAATLMFFSLLRIGNVLSALTSFDPQKHLRRCDITFSPLGAVVHIRHTKTIQFGDRTLTFPLPRLKDHVLCPSRALLHATKCVKAGPQEPALLVKEGVPLSPDKFIHILRSLLKDFGDDVSEFGGHSFRRGGCSFGYKQNIDLVSLKILGDWKSEAYSAYIIPSEALLASATSKMGMAIAKLSS